MPDPWFKFYPAQWRADPRLRMCSIAARGLWIEMLSIMHEAEPRGHLLVHGRPPTDTQLAVLAGIPPNQLPELLSELEGAGVFSRTSKGVIYSRRMTRDTKRALAARKNGRKGGNPAIVGVPATPENETGISPSVNPMDNPPDKPPDKGGLKHKKIEDRDKGSVSFPPVDTYGKETGADAPPPEVDFAKALFDRGVAFLGRHGLSERQARAVIGRWRKDHHDPEIFDAFAAASRAGVVDPVAWITARLTTPADKAAQVLSFAEMMEAMRDAG